MGSDQGPVVLGAMLRAELQRLRAESKLTQEQVSKDLEWSVSKIIRIEGGSIGISKSDMLVLLQHYGVAPTETHERLLSLAQGARTPGWWTSYRDTTSKDFLTFVGYEAGASEIRTYQGLMVPGLLQIRRYAEVIASTFARQKDTSSVVSLRLKRQEELGKRTETPRQYYLLDEAAVRRHVGFRRDPMIMVEQVEHLIQVADASEVTLQIVPLEAGEHRGMRGSFTLLNFAGNLGPVLYLEEGRRASQMITGDDSQIPDYREDFDEIRNVALSPMESIELLKQVAQNLRSRAGSSGPTDHRLTT